MRCVGVFIRGGRSQFQVMDQSSEIRSPTCAAEREEREDCGDGDGRASWTKQCQQCGTAGKTRCDEETFGRFFMRTDCLLIDSLNFSDRIRGGASRVENRDRAECSEDYDRERGAQERRVAKQCSGKHQRRCEELAEEWRVVEHEVKVDGVRKMRVHV